MDMYFGIGGDYIVISTDENMNNKIIYKINSKDSFFELIPNTVNINSVEMCFYRLDDCNDIFKNFNLKKFIELRKFEKISYDDFEIDLKKSENTLYYIYILIKQYMLNLDFKEDLDHKVDLYRINNIDSAIKFLTTSIFYDKDTFRKYVNKDKRSNIFLNFGEIKLQRGVNLNLLISKDLKNYKKLNKEEKEDFLNKLIKMYYIENTAPLDHFYPSLDINYGIVKNLILGGSFDAINDEIENGVIDDLNNLENTIFINYNGDNNLFRVPVINLEHIRYCYNLFKVRLKIRDTKLTAYELENIVEPWEGKVKETYKLFIKEKDPYKIKFYKQMLFDLGWRFSNNPFDNNVVFYQKVKNIRYLQNSISIDDLSYNISNMDKIVSGLIDLSLLKIDYFKPMTGELPCIDDQSFMTAILEFADLDDMLKRDYVIDFFKLMLKYKRRIYIDERTEFGKYILNSKDSDINIFKKYINKYQDDDFNILNEKINVKITSEIDQDIMIIETNRFDKLDEKLVEFKRNFRSLSGSLSKPGVRDSFKEELFKMYMIITAIDQKYMKPKTKLTAEERKEYKKFLDTRSRYLNIFNNRLTEYLEVDPEFDFYKEYRFSKYSNAIKIDQSKIAFGVKLFNSFVKNPINNLIQK